MEKIYVIVPVYNLEKYILRCLNSILNNTYQDLEVIVVDDGSTDNSYNIINSIADNRIKCFKQENSGVSSARNLALSYIEKCVGGYISFIDGDDFIHPQFFDVLVKVLNQYHADICVGGYKIVYSSDIEMNEVNPPLNGVISDVNIVPRYVWSRIYRKEILQGLRFDENVKLGEDACFSILAVTNKENTKIVYIDEPIYFYYTRSDSAVHILSSIELVPKIKCLSNMINDVKTINGKAIVLYEYVKTVIAYRYLSGYDDCLNSDRKQIIKQFLQKYYSLKRFLSIKKRLIINIFILFPFIYRLFRIINDPTMIEWERNCKAKLKQNKQ